MSPEQQLDFEASYDLKADLGTCLEQLKGFVELVGPDLPAAVVRGRDPLR